MARTTDEPKVLMSAAPTHQRRVVGDTERAWRWVAWFSLVLTLAGFGDWVLAWIPTRFGNPDWEFGTVVSTISGLPLISIGLAGLVGAAFVTGIRWQLMTLATFLFAFGTAVILSVAVLALNIPLALNAVEGVAETGILKALAKTFFLAGLFVACYFGAGVAALKFLAKKR